MKLYFSGDLLGTEEDSRTKCKVVNVTSTRKGLI